LQLRLDRTNDAFGDAILKIEDVADITFEAIRPDVRPRTRLDQLRRDTKPIARAPNAALQYVAYPELASNLAHIDILALVGEGRVSGDNEQPGAARECRDDF